MYQFMFFSLFKFSIILILLVIFCEYAIYYIVLSQVNPFSILFRRDLTIFIFTIFYLCSVFGQR